VAAGGPAPWPGDLAASELKGGAKVLGSDLCEAYRAAWTAFRRACGDVHARRALVLLDGLLDAFGTAYSAAKTSRAAVDFEDLELRARELLAEPPARRRWAERFALIMVDEFQDTNRLQLDLLEALERDNLFAVGDEFQSIYRFRHADVGIFRARAGALGAGRVRSLAVNFRSAEELLDVLNAGFSAELGPRFRPLVAGRAAPGGDLRLFDPDGPAGAPRVELLVTDTRGWEDHEERLGLAGGGDARARRAEARLVAHRLRAEIDDGRRPGDVVVLVRATASLRLLEEALEEQGVPTYVVGGRGYWSSEQVRDGLAWLRVLANPLDEPALLTVLASPFCGAGTDALVLLAAAGREAGGLWAALRAGGPPPAPLDRAQAGRIAAVGALLETERQQAERTPVDVLLERAVAATGYDLAILARDGGERRFANLRKLMRLARAYEATEGPDLRGFLAYAAAQDLAAAREGEAALESDGLEAVRLMTIHRAKGLEFPVVCLADLGRTAAPGRSRLLLGEDGTAGLRLAPLGGGETVPTAAWQRLADADALAEAEEERRLMYVAMTRAQEKLILAGATDAGRWPEPRPGGAPIDWIVRAIAGDPASAFPVPDGGAAGCESGRGAGGPGDGGAGGPGDGGAGPGDGDAGRGRHGDGDVGRGRHGDGDVGRGRHGDGDGDGSGTQDGDERGNVLVDRRWAGRPARVLCRLNAPATLGTVLPETALAPRSPAPAAAPTALPARPIAVPAAAPRPRPAPQRLSYTSLSDYARCPYRHYLRRDLGLPAVAPPPAAAEAPADARQASGLDPLVRGTIVHRALEDLDFARPAAPPAATVRRLAADAGVDPADADVADVQALVRAFAGSPLCARLAAATRVSREAPFAFALEPDGAGPLVNGFVDVLATEPGGGVLVVDYKTDRLEGDAPAVLVDRDYATQRLVYALAALRGGAPWVDVAHCLLERPAEPVVRRYTAADAPELAERVAALAGGLLRNERPVAARPHRELCGDCPGRRRLCSWPESMTLRDPAEAAVAPAGAGLVPQSAAGSLTGSAGPS
jgi:ATP-dependent helicase/nuclease subunit A